MEEIKNERNKEIKIIIILVVMSFFAGIYISYYISYISALFVKIVGPDTLPLAYIVSGLGGSLMTNIYNKLEIKYSFLSVTSLFVLFISISLLIVWHYCTTFENNNLVIFLSYSWFWISGNFVLLVFWKLPTILLNLGQNKKFTGLISSGEVISAIIAYLSVPFIISQGIITKESNLLLISLIGITCFLILLFILPLRKSVHSKKVELNNKIKETNTTFYELMKSPFFRLIFFSVLFSVFIQSTIDYSLMLITKEIITETKYLAAFFGSIFGFSKLFEFFLKTTLSNKMLKLFGVQVGLFAFSLVIGIVTVIGLFSNYFGAITFLFIATLMSKIMERSLSRALFTPSISILFQVYVGKIKSIVQNYGDGYGKTFGQLIAGVVLLAISYSTEFYTKFTLLHIFILISAGIIFKMSAILSPLYREKLMHRIARMVSFDINSGNNKMDVIPDSIKFNTMSAMTNLSTPFNSTDDLKIIKYSDIKARITQETVLATYFQNLPVDNIDNVLLKLKAFNNDILYSILKILSKKNNLFLEKNTIYYEILLMLIDKYGSFLSILNTLDDKAGVDLKLSINTEIINLMDMIYMCLSLANEKEIINSIKTLNSSLEVENQIIALEILGLILDKQEKAYLLPIFQESNQNKIIRKLEKFIPIVKQNYTNTLLSLIFQNPASTDVIPRYFALIEAIDKNIISDDQLITICFCPDVIIKNYAFFILKKKSISNFLELSQRTKYDLPLNYNFQNDFILVEKLNSFKLPNFIKSKLLYCLTNTQDNNFEVIDPVLYEMIKNRYQEHKLDIDFLVMGS
ncbi:MAG: hypothetical protein NWS66_12325 [Saprospiraceae bacterium]|nr:hypothetical protein [Saprospiraceae bacterium]MDP4700722.1 hypothetical protein [Saprospiraceae bacterium]MDP4815641.1 hypothetical protein [Saprospiraceae bacterium]MDP5047997.1 hypothetical protein [Saprospiraceae bacterium]